MIDKGLTYAYAEGGPVASEGRPRPNPFVRPMPNGKPVYNNITVGGPAVLPPAAAPVGDLFPQQPVFDRQPIIDYFDENGKRVFIGIDGRFPQQPVVPPPPLGRMEPIIDYFDENGKRVFIGIDGRFPDQPVVPPPVQPVVPPPVTGPDGTSRTYSPPIFSRPSAADTRAAGYDAAIQRFANSPFVRPEGIMGLQRGKLRLS
jgi:hypothetical protein